LRAETSANRANRTLISQSTAEKIKRTIHVIICGNSVATVRRSSEYVTVLCMMYLLNLGLTAGSNQVQSFRNVRCPHSVASIFLGNMQTRHSADNESGTRMALAKLAALVGKG